MVSTRAIPRDKLAVSCLDAVTTTIDIVLPSTTTGGIIQGISVALASGTPAPGTVRVSGGLMRAFKTTPQPTLNGRLTDEDPVWTTERIDYRTNDFIRIEIRNDSGATITVDATVTVSPDLAPEAI